MSIELLVFSYDLVHVILLEFSVFHVAHITLECHVWHENTEFNIPFSGKSVDLARKVFVVNW